MDALLKILRDIIFDASYHRMMGHSLSEAAQLIYESYKDKLMVIPCELAQEVNIYEAKKCFVERELFSLIRKIDFGIQQTEYIKDEQGERVTVRIKDSVPIIVDVTADSFLAIVNDVLEALK